MKIQSLPSFDEAAFVRTYCEVLSVKESAAKSAFILYDALHRAGEPSRLGSIQPDVSPGARDGVAW
jgi:hypothetical protein